MPTKTYDDKDLTVKNIQSLETADRLAELFAYLNYPVLETRLPMTAQALALSDRLSRAVTHSERLASVEDGQLEIYLFELKTVTQAHIQSLARAFRNRGGMQLLVLTDDYERLDFVFLEQVGRGKSFTLRPNVLTVDRRKPNPVDLRVLRRFTLTEYDEGVPDAFAQYDKLHSAYVVAEWAEPLFNNRALFSDYYLNNRLRELAAWNDPDRNQAFAKIHGLMTQARRTLARQDAALTRDSLIWPVLQALGFKPEPDGDTGSDFLLAVGGETPAAFVLAYPWNRNLDARDDSRDPDRPDANPGAQAVSLLEAEVAPWAIVTNGKLWRLYSHRAHSRATNYYEIDLEETLAEPDAAEPFRYFYLFFRAAAFRPEPRRVAGEDRVLSFLDWLMEESASYARELGERLKDRVFEQIFPHFAEGFIAGLGGPDALIDQIVYRLYGLTPDEIAVVEGNA